MPTYLQLICHPVGVAPTKLAIKAEVQALANGGLQFAYEIAGASTLTIPPLTTPNAVDGLWQHTCCEAFVASAGCPDYREFNFSPSRCWAAYRFHGYRDRDLGWQAPETPTIDCILDVTEERLTLVANVPASLLPDSPQLEISLTTVAEDREGQKSYWALAHRAAQPDFHCRDSFALLLNRS